MRKLLLSALIITSLLSVNAFAKKNNSNDKIGKKLLEKKKRLGKHLFFDTDLSEPKGMSCASCHSQETAFVDPNSELPVSQGINLERFGNRNTPTAAYASFTPPFHFDENEGLYIGGQFLDGRASTLKDQAKGPFLNPVEMAMPSEEAVVERVKKSSYAKLFKKVYGKNIFDNPIEAYDSIADAIAHFETTKIFHPFKSKYDRFLAGKVELTENEQNGLALFMGKAQCSACHPATISEDGTPPLFTDYTYDNLGVPKNGNNPFYKVDPTFNPTGYEFVDLGLGGVLNKAEENGKFKVPTLRNIAKTAPYMHNGVFNTLKEVVAFYNTRDLAPWPSPEVNENVNESELGNLGLTNKEEDDIVAFLKTLTDR
jgi:cytochrome c peroxidase